ncbi:MAG: Xaa-Pro aminopeptidase [Cycloclasticus pugetii]|uniref:Xaa-Pro aminopeptidase n=1 Tax=Cycloclasticus pugetii TaxID=34068 RepID=A0AB33Z187_9GAMM|nr:MULTISPECIES: Xaa-Pro aminopeptidase [Cycloclasticus]AFT67994.1 Peptidase M24 [Cycloclasticus sp. P1]ATI02469.1 Xaa-Pro aminopeptidase [Cycloclasticus sp. PY97N]EPD12933.1 peptidase M24 [Cycloclasticus pugetii]
MIEEQKEFARRRQQFLRMVGEGNIAVIASASIMQRNSDVEFHFRQNSDFFYLSGFDEPESVIVFVPGREQGEYVLFCREYDEKTALWVGASAGLEGAVRDYAVDDAFPIDDIDDILPGLLENKNRLYFPMGAQPDFDQQLMDWSQQVRGRSRAGVSAPAEFISSDHILHEMRLIKSAQEIKWMKKAAKISVKAHIKAMQSCRPGMYEYQVEANLKHCFMSHGAQQEAYPAIVGGGHNGCVLHYIDNNAVLNDGDLLLIDAGCEWKKYASDITRTFPVNGVFNEEQKALYQLVLDAQYAAIEQVKPGNHWNDPHDAAVEVLTKGLVRLGLLQGSLSTLIKNEAYKPYYMHRTGHWLGMDVHDVGDYKLDDQWRLLEPGMVLTVEPGLYIHPNANEVDKKWRGIGIRIEDDVLVTKKGHEVLTDSVPKEIKDIESLMSKVNDD